MNIYQYATLAVVDASRAAFPLRVVNTGIVIQLKAKLPVALRHGASSPKTPPNPTPQAPDPKPKRFDDTTEHREKEQQQEQKPQEILPKTRPEDEGPLFAA